MKRPGQIALLRLARTDLAPGKLRPVLLLRRASSRFDDWLVCMVTSRLHQAEPDLDEPILPTDPDFADTGLKAPSMARLSRLAVVEGATLAGALGAVAPARLQRMRERLARWILQEPPLS